MGNRIISSWNEYQEPEKDNESNLYIHVDYYQRPFFLFHDQLKREGFLLEEIHPIRERYWGLLPKGIYEPLESRTLIKGYITSINNQLEQIISEHSIAYWLHLYRRLLPGPIGKNEQPLTIGETRATLEAAMQKFATKNICTGVGRSGVIKINKVLGGLLMNPEFELERKIVQANDQLVLTNFTASNLYDFYKLEKLAYEMWRSNAMLRIVGKGALIVVDDSPEFVYDIRSDELDQIVSNYDSRIGKLDYTLSSTGVVRKSFFEDEDYQGMIIIPFYNINLVKLVEFINIFSGFKINISSYSEDMITNFIWAPFPIRQYRDTHLPFADAFKEKHRVDFDTVLVIITALFYRVLFIIQETEGYSIIRFWQRAYEGPYKKEYIINEIIGFLPTSKIILGISDKKITKKEIEKAYNFWELNEQKRNLISVDFPGPHSIFLPYGKGRYFIDYAWIYWQFYYLFTGISIPDQNFKGDLLEELIRGNKSILHKRGCRLTNGESKQIDASFEIDNKLIIVECRVFGQSIGYFRGDPESIRYRSEKISEALINIDEKANWLANNPIGTNFDISSYSAIIPIVVTPFVEYIPSADKIYWLNNSIPRVLSPLEFKQALESNEFNNDMHNIVEITN